MSVTCLPVTALLECDTYTTFQKHRAVKGAPMDPIPEFAQLQWDFMDPIQRRYEIIRPLVLFTEGTAAQRAQDTDLHPDTVRRWLHDFRQHGMLGLLPAGVTVEQQRRGLTVS